MPFLRSKRGNLASESELRRSAALPPNRSPFGKDLPLRSAFSSIDLPRLQTSNLYVSTRTAPGAEAEAGTDARHCTAPPPLPPVPPLRPLPPVQPLSPFPPLQPLSHLPPLPLLRPHPSSSAADAGAGVGVASGAAGAADADIAPSDASTPVIPAPPVTPPHDSLSYSTAAAATATALSPHDSIERPRPDSPPFLEETSKHRRFSMLRFRNASDSQLSTRVKKEAHVLVEENVPPVPRLLPVNPQRPHPPQRSITLANRGHPGLPNIITTAPTVDFSDVPRKTSRMFGRIRRSGEEPRPEPYRPPVQALSKKDRRKSFLPGAAAIRRKSSSVEVPRPPSSSNPPTDNDLVPPLPLPLPCHRLSESSRSEDSAERARDNSSPATMQAASSTNNFWRLTRRRPKQPEPLFPIAHLQKKHSHEPGEASSTSLAPSTPIRERASPTTCGFVSQQPPFARDSTGAIGLTTPPGASPAHAILHKPNASPATSPLRQNSRNSSAASPTRSNMRGRSSTMSSLGRESVEERLAPPFSRTSTSTGRKSFGDLLRIGRLRNNPDSIRQGTGTPATPGSNASKDNSLNIQRESVVLPEKREDENPGRYLDRLDELASRSAIPAALSKNSDAFSLAVLRSYMRRFGFFGDPMDMAIRKLLMSAELPKETQHIDRFLQAFANRYHECNPGIYTDPDQAYFIAFSLLILHTDVFNKNNKHKMSKPDYIKNTKGEGIFDDILQVFYDNITYTPFIHVEDDLDINGDRILGAQKGTKKRSVFANTNPPDNQPKKSAREPIDPYTLILDNRLDVLRPNLKDVMHLDDHFSYLGTVRQLNLKELQNTFFRTGILQIVSARSRPDAFMSEKTATNPQEAQPGVVDIKVTKVGLLWRKDVKKKKTRSPWQEWGAILTGAQLYFFRNTTWVKSLMHQYDYHIRQGHDGIPIIFKPPLEMFKPDALMSTDGAVALLDSTYKKHKNAFVYVRHGGLEEILLADNEDEMNDWLAKLNYAAAFRTNGVRMRGVLGSNSDGQGRRTYKRLDTEAVQTPVGEMAISPSKFDHQMARDILFARREIMFHKVADANDKLQQEEKKLDQQLRNARHLQLLSPIQPKTRDQLLMAAARMAAQLKWTRIEIWKIKCHRDILLLDLEEERQMLGLPAGPMSEAIKPERPPLGREVSKSSSGTATSGLPTPIPADSKRSHAGGHAAAESTDTESVKTDAVPAPPRTPSAAPASQSNANSWEIPTPSFDQHSLRNSSVSSVVSASAPASSTPPRSTATIGTAAVTASAPSEEQNEPDAHEREFLEQAGLLDTETNRSSEMVEPPKNAGPDATAERHEHTLHGSLADKVDKNKIRRSLQRTLREGAGHLSHTRNRKGKDPVFLGSVEANESEMLPRGSGSFVVHGKKASVITFGSEFQSLSPDERLRARKTSQLEDSPANGGDSEAGNAVVCSEVIPGEVGLPAHTLFCHHNNSRERRSSVASIGTATAKSFEDVHRKFSAVAGKVSWVSSSDENLESAPDGDGAADMSSLGRHCSPMFAEQVGDVEEKGEKVRGEDDEVYDEEYDEYNSDLESLTMNEARETLFFTPELPDSPTSDQSSPGESGGEEATKANGKGEERRNSPAVPVSA